MTQVRPHAFAPKGGGMESRLHFISTSKRNSGMDAVPGPGARFSAPAHPGWPKFNLTCSRRKPAGWKAVCVFSLLPEGLDEHPSVPAAIYIYITSTGGRARLPHSRKGNPIRRAQWAGNARSQELGNAGSISSRSMPR